MAAGMSVAGVLTIGVAAGCVGVAVGEDVVGCSHKAGGIKGMLGSVGISGMALGVAGSGLVLGVSSRAVGIGGIMVGM